ncbi:MAG: hypothetical protein ACFFCQ_02900 [Promethearchaeota archaeon]
MLPVESLKQAKLLAEQGNTQQALDLLNNAYQILQANMPDPSTPEGEEKYSAAKMVEGQIEAIMGEILLNNEEYHDALPHLLSALTIFRTQEVNVEPKDIITCLEKLGETFGAIGSSLESDKYFLEAIEEKSKLIRTILTNMLQGAGWKVKMDVPMQDLGGKIDILAVKGAFKKKQQRIWLVRDAEEVSTLMFLVKQIKGKKTFYLLKGDPASVYLTDKYVKVVNDPQEISL